MIEGLNINTVITMEFDTMLKLVWTLVEDEVPEGSKSSEDAIERIDRMLGRWANIFAFLSALEVHVSEKAERLKQEGKAAEWKLMLRKKDALEKMASAADKKWNAVSRMLTVRQIQNEYRTEHRNWGNVR